MFDTYEVSVKLVRAVHAIEPTIQRHDAALADQLHRACMSITLNVAESSRSSPGNKRRHYMIAQGSAAEVKACIDLAEVYGWIECPPELREYIDRQLALLWSLTHPRRSRS